MNTTTALLRAEAVDSTGFLRRVGRALLGTAAVFVVGVGALPAVEATAAGVATGVKHVSAQHVAAPSAVDPSAIPAETRAAAARFVVGQDGKLTRVG